MKRVYLLALSCVMLFVLSGCANPIETFVKTKVSTYASQTAKEDTVDESSGTTDGEAHKQVKIVFAKNKFISTEYYYDEDLTQKVDTDNCYLNPGESVYFSNVECSSPFSNMYEFSAFKVFEYSDGTKTEFTSLYSAAQNCVLTVPNDYAGTELIVEPYGNYPQRKIEHSVVYIDSTGTQKNVNVDEYSWYVNDEILDEEGFNPSESYTLKCVLNNDKYYCVESYPQWYNNDIENKTIEFATASSSDDTSSYTVVLREYITIEFNSENKSDATVTLNGTEALEIKDLEDKELSSVKCDDKLVIEINKDYELASSIFGEMPTPETISDGERLRYTLTIPETNDTKIYFTIKKSDNLVEFKKSTIDNASISVKFEEGSDKLIDGVKYDKDLKVVVQIIPNTGYYVDGKNVTLTNNKYSYSKVMKLSNYIESIDSIIKEHPIKELYKIVLNSEDEYGTCTFTVNGDPVTGNVYLRADDEIKLTYKLNDKENYSIKRESTNIFDKAVNFVKDKTNSSQQSVTVKASEIKNGTFNRSDYITVEKGAK